MANPSTFQNQSMNMTEWISINDRLPNDKQIVKCWGQHTLCCEEDMDDFFGEYEAKFEFYEDGDHVWNCGFPPGTDYGCGNGHVMNVTKWKPNE